MNNNDGCCNLCKWWDEMHSGLGRCRRYPPHPIAGVESEIGPIPAWFVTGTVDWCGEFKYEHE